MKIKLIITGVALIIFIFGLGYFVWGIIYFIDGDLIYPDCPYNYYESECKPLPPRECYNGPIPGVKTECGPACPNPQVFNQPWSKYERATKCVKVPELNCPNCCGYGYRISLSKWYSIADKLQSNCNNGSCGERKDGYLAAGKCEPEVSGGFYKVCCNPDGTVGKSGPFFQQDNVNPPTEGICTVGRPVIVESGLDTSIPPGATSTHCTTTASTTPPDLPGSTSPPNPPDLRTRAGGICNPAIKIKVRKQGTTQGTTLGTLGWQVEGVRKITYNSPDTTNEDYLLKKNNTLEFDVELVNKGESDTTECEYQECKRICGRFPCKEIKCEENEEGEIKCREETKYQTKCASGRYKYPDKPQGCDEAINYWCPDDGWDHSKTKTYSNEPICEIKEGERVQVRVSLNQNLVYKFINTDGSTSKYGVNAKTSFGKTFTFLSREFRRGEIAEHQEKDGIAQIQPQRHGTYYVLAEKSGGEVYNKADDPIVVSADGVTKKYNWCIVKEWTGNGWRKIRKTSETGKGPFTLWQGESTSSVDVSSAQVEFYVQPTNVEPILRITTPNITHPPAKTTNQIYIAGYPFGVEYGVEFDGYWGEDMGGYWLSGLEFYTIGSGQTQTYQITPRIAGSSTITVYHNADDEKLSQRNIPESEGYRPEVEPDEAIGNLESQSITIQVYRYLCYQGFCWECPDEPQREGIRLKVQEAGCKVVEDIKCQTYVSPNPHKSCKGGVKE